MRKPNLIKTAIKNLTVGGNPLVVNTERERVMAHYHARANGIKIQTQRRLDGSGMTIVRTV